MPVAIEQTSTGEVRVETGTGVIKELTHEPGKRNAHVVITATHVRLDSPVSCWADTTDGAVWPLAGELYADGKEVEYRIEVKRKNDVPADKPFADLKKTEKVRDLAAIAPKGKLSAVDRIRPENAANAPESEPPDDPPPSPPPTNPRPPAAAQAPTGADETPPADTGWLTEAGREATEQRQAHRDQAAAGDRSAETGPPANRAQACAPCGIDRFDNQAAAVEHANTFAHKEAVARARKSVETRRASTFDEEAGHLDRAVPPPARRGPRIEEGKPWERTNSDGSLNLASYAFTAVVGFVELAHDLCSKRVADVQAEGGDRAELKMSQVQSLATTLLNIADRVQAMTRMDGRVDRMDQSHTRSRGAVRTALRVYPVPFNVDKETRDEWADNVANHAAAMLRISLDLFRFDTTGEGT